MNHLPICFVLACYCHYFISYCFITLSFLSSVFTGHIGEKGKAVVNARTLSGQIYLKTLDWIQTVKLGLKSDDET